MDVVHLCHNSGAITENLMNLRYAKLYSFLMLMYSQNKYYMGQRSEKISINMSVVLHPGPYGKDQ